MSIVDKCVKWNRDRYPRTLNNELAISLLFEELDELDDAVAVIDKLDACGDIVFVAIGILWKLGIHERTLNEFFYQEDLSVKTQQELYQFMGSVMYTIFENDYVDVFGDMVLVSTTVHAVFVTVFNKLRKLGLQHRFYDIVEAICKSNSTKMVVMTSPELKANIVKGVGYISPTEDLLKILNGVN